MSVDDVPWDTCTVKPHYIVVVRAKKDRDAVKACLEKFYQNWIVKVESLGGLRNPDEASQVIHELLREYQSSFILFLGGREDARIVKELDSKVPDARFAAIMINKMRVRNARLEEIFWSIEKARSKLRLRLYWNPDTQQFVLHERKPNAQPIETLIEPYCDVFIATEGWIKWVNKLGLKCRAELLLERLGGGIHKLFMCGQEIGELHIPDDARLKPSLTMYEPVEECIPKRNIVDENKHVVEVYESIALEWIRNGYEYAESVLGDVDAVVIPWSGGKDSTIALYLARKALTSRIAHQLIAVHVDMGLEFPHTKLYVDSLKAELNIKVETVHVNLLSYVRERGFPTHNNRWCTGLKIEALRSVLKKLGEKLVIIVGDRDAESEARSRRPVIRREKFDNVNAVVVAPLKQWSTALTQVYAEMHNIPLNQLYKLGFYRIGCYICPSLRSWELMLMLKDFCVAAPLLGKPLYFRYVMYRLRQG